MLDEEFQFFLFSDNSTVLKFRQLVEGHQV